MTIRIQFLGAAENVTGSRTLVETENARVLVDCGLYQERKLVERNWDQLAVKPSSIDAVLLTHAHLDHCGWLPKLVADGFTGPIYTTEVSAEIAKVVMLDSAHIQEEDARFKAKRHAEENRKKTRPVVPLYTSDQAQEVGKHFRTVTYKEKVKIADGISAVFHDGGHILGSSIIKMTVKDSEKERTILFSGDVGRKNRPILRDPTIFEQADYVVMESTYGDRTHPVEDDVETLLAEAINKTAEAGGNLLIPAFAIERSQELLFHLNNLHRAGKIPQLMTFLDSPMAVSVTKIFQEHTEIFDEATRTLLCKGHSPFDMPGLKLVRTADTSKSINYIRGSCIIIAGSGMCTGGRIKHHLVHNVNRPESTVLFVGYQAAGTLGRHILDGQKEVRILGRMHEIRCGIRRIHGFSGHADQRELTEWITSLKTPPRKVLINHGEKQAADAFAKHLSKETGWEVIPARFGSHVDLD